MKIEGILEGIVVDSEQKRMSKRVAHWKEIDASNFGTETKKNKRGQILK